jgi:hypothetical protein
MPLSPSVPSFTLRARLARLKRRRDERGATIFVVLTVMTLLTAVGVYAARSASLVTRAAGFDRQFSQTHYVAAYGTLALAAELGTGTATMQVSRMAQAPQDCRVTRNLTYPGGGAAPCLRFSMAELANRVDGFNPGRNLLEPSVAGPPIVPGSLGPYPPSTGAALDGNFAIELSEPGPVERPVAGTDVGGSGTSFRYLRVTATTQGQVAPVTAGGNCLDGAAAVAGLETMRAFIEFGPVASN